MKRTTDVAARAVAAGMVSLLCAGLAACGGESSSNAKAAKKADNKPWESTHGAFNAPDWKTGDKEAWELQLRARAQQQNEYTKAR